MERGNALGIAIGVAIAVAVVVVGAVYAAREGGGETNPFTLLLGGGGSASLHAASSRSTASAFSNFTPCYDGTFDLERARNRIVIDGIARELHSTVRAYLSTYRTFLGSLSGLGLRTDDDFEVAATWLTHALAENSTLNAARGARINPRADPRNVPLMRESVNHMTQLIRQLVIIARRMATSPSSFASTYEPSNPTVSEALILAQGARSEPVVGVVGHQLALAAGQPPPGPSDPTPIPPPRPGAPCIMAQLWAFNRDRQREASARADAVGNDPANVNLCFQAATMLHIRNNRQFILGEISRDSRPCA